MASPFKIFRKYSGGIMIVMVILSMMLFTLTDLFTDPSANLWLLGLLIGGAVFGVAGIGQGKWLQWGIGGAVLGAALGFILPGFVEGDGLSTSLGVIDEEEMYDLEVRRSVANQFLFRATEASFGEGTGRFATLFGFGHQSSREDVIFGKLLRAEADRLGITVDPGMVTDYLNRATSDKLTKEDYVNVRNELGYKNQKLDDSTLISILSDEIKARMAYQMLRPRTTSLPPGPEVYWEYFQRLNVRQQLNIAALDVDEFIDKVGEPSDNEVSSLFASYAKKFPNQDEPGSPGFRLPFRTRLAWVEADTKTVEGEVGDVTDAEIEAYYNENKETPLIRRPVIPDFDVDTKPEEAASGDSKPETETKPAEPAAEPTDTEKTESSEKPTKESKPEADAAGDADAPKATEEEAKPEPEATEPAESDAGTESSEAPADDSCGPFEPDEAQPADETAAETESSDEEKAEPVAAEEKESATKEGDTAAPATEEKPAADEDPATEEKPADSTPPTLTIPDAPAVPEKPETPDAPKEPEYEYRELDDELKQEIREEIIRQRVDAAIAEKMEKAVTQMETLARERSSHRFSLIEEDPGKYEGSDEEQQAALKELRESMAGFDQELNDKLKKFAADNGLAYSETGMISYAELLDEQDYPIGSATEPSENPMMMAQSATVAQTVFQSFSNDEQNNDAQLFLVRQAQRRAASLDGGQFHYAYWATDFSPSHVPQLNEDGVRELVVLAWKREKARELVTKRGEELAAKVRDGLKKEGDEKQDMSAALADMTVAGGEDSPALAVRKTLPFSWLRTSSASPMSFQAQQATLSTIQFEDSVGSSLEKVGETFMEAVFNDMQDEEVKVIPNGDLSQYFVVHVTNRFPTPEIGMDGLRERFASEGKQFAFAQSPMISVMQQQIDGPASLAWERSLWKRYGIDPDGEPEEE